MKRLLVLLVWIVVPISAHADHLVDRADMKWAVLNACNVSQSGTSQLTTAQVDSIVNEAQLAVATDFAGAYLKWDTIACASGQRVYSLNSDVLGNVDQPVVWCYKAPYQAGNQQGQEGTFIPSIPWNQANLSLSSQPIPKRTDQPGFVCATAGNLFVHPTPRAGDTLILTYRAVPLVLDDDTVTIRIGSAFKDAMKMWAVKECLFKLGRDNEAAFVAARYEGLKVKKSQSVTTFQEAEQ